MPNANSTSTEPAEAKRLGISLFIACMPASLAAMEAILEAISPRRYYLLELLAVKPLPRLTEPGTGNGSHVRGSPVGARWLYQASASGTKDPRTKRTNNPGGDFSPTGVPDQW